MGAEARLQTGRHQRADHCAVARDRRQELSEEIAEYARENAGTSADLDVDLEAAGIESLRKIEE